MLVAMVKKINVNTVVFILSPYTVFDQIANANKVHPYLKIPTKKARLKIVDDEMTEFNIIDFGAKGDSRKNHASAIPKAIDACSANGGGRVLVLAGYFFLSAPLNFNSDVEFYIESGAKIIAIPGQNVYTENVFRENRSEGAVWIGGKNANWWCAQNVWAAR